MAKGLQRDPATIRTQISRADLQMAIANAVKSSDPQCGSFVGIIVERISPASRIGANWSVKGIKYGEAKRDLCDATISVIIDTMQLEFDVLD